MTDKLDMAGDWGEDQFTTDNFKRETRLRRIYRFGRQWQAGMASYELFIVFLVTLKKKPYICKLGKGGKLQTVDLEKVVCIENLIAASLAYHFTTSWLLFWGKG